MEQQLAAGLREWQIAEFIQHNEVHPAQVFRHPSLAAGAPLGLELVDQLYDIEEPPTLAVAYQRPCYGDGQVRLAGAGSADQHDIALMRQEVSACQVAHQGLVDRRVIEPEVIDILGQWQFGD